MNDLMSLGVHRIWKRNLINWMNPGKNKILADVACGTGDIAKLFIDNSSNKNIELFCIDPNEGMMKREKIDYQITKISSGLRVRQRNCL